MIELQIQHGAMRYMPAVESGIALDWQRRGSPGKLTFTAVDDGALQLGEGDAVTFHVDGKPVFLGFLFTRRSSGDGLIQCTAYDQLRYLKNKDTYIYADKTATELLAMVAADFHLQVGELEDTGFKIASRVEDDKTLFDILQNALDITFDNTGKLYVLYDDFGKLTLKGIESMVVPLLIDWDTAQSYDYASTIDSATYNKIKLGKEDKESGQRSYFFADDKKTIAAWGTLQYAGKVEDGENGQAKAAALLQLYNQVTKTLSVRGAFGDVRVRAGSTVAVKLDLGDMTVNSGMLVEKVQHQFEEGLHTMDLTLRGGGVFV